MVQPIFAIAQLHIRAYDVKRTRTVRVEFVRDPVPSFISHSCFVVCCESQLLSKWWNVSEIALSTV